MDNSNLASFKELANDITLEKDFALLCQCIDVLYRYLNGDTSGIGTPYLPGSIRARVKVSRIVSTVLSVFPESYIEEERDALEALKIIKKKIPSWRLASLRDEFKCVESAIKVKRVWRRPTESQLSKPGK